MPDWTHRIVEHPEGVFEVRQVHVNNGREIGMSLGPSIFSVRKVDGESDEAIRAEIIASMERALKEAREQPILRPPASWV